MWKLRKIGFHLYTGAQIFIIALPVAFIPAYPFSMLSVLVTAAFLIGYAVHLKINGLVKLSGMEENENLIPENKRPFFISILCFSVFVYSAVFILIFLATAIFNNWIYYVLNDYLPENGVEKSVILWLSLTGIVLYCGSFFGAFLIWRMKRAGLYTFLAASALNCLFALFVWFWQHYQYDSVCTTGYSLYFFLQKIKLI